MKKLSGFYSTVVLALTLTAIDVSGDPLFPFYAFTKGAFSSAGIPPGDVVVQIDHPDVTAQPFEFSSLTASERILFGTQPPSIVDGTFTFSNDEGTLLGSFYGSLIPFDPNAGQYQAICPFVFSGGTGMFTGAGGGGQLDAFIQFGDPTGSYGTSEISWEGRLSLPCVCPEMSATLPLLGLGLCLLAAGRKLIRMGAV